MPWPRISGQVISHALRIIPCVNESKVYSVDAKFCWTAVAGVAIRSGEGLYGEDKDQCGSHNGTEMSQNQIEYQMRWMENGKWQHLRFHIMLKLERQETRKVVPNYLKHETVWRLVDGETTELKRIITKFMRLGADCGVWREEEFLQELQSILKYTCHEWYVLSFLMSVVLVCCGICRRLEVEGMRKILVVIIMVFRQSHWFTWEEIPRVVNGVAWFVFGLSGPVLER